jgi:hypothetical protein
MRILLAIVGVALAALGGVIAYRAFFVEPDAAIVITKSSVREVPNLARGIGGLALLVVGAGIAFFAALRRAR